MNFPATMRGAGKALLSPFSFLSSLFCRWLLRRLERSLRAEMADVSKTMQRKASVRVVVMNVPPMMLAHLAEISAREHGWQTRRMQAKPCPVDMKSTF